MDRFDFGTWIRQEREKRGWAQAELARRSGAHRQAINKIENGATTPSLDTFLGLSEAFQISPIVLFRKAGLLPPGSEEEINFNDWEYMLSRLNKRDRELLKQNAINMIESYVAKDTEAKDR